MHVTTNRLFAGAGTNHFGHFVLTRELLPSMRSLVRPCCLRAHKVANNPLMPACDAVRAGRPCARCSSVVRGAHLGQPGFGRPALQGRPQVHALCRIWCGAHPCFALRYTCSHAAPCSATAPHANDMHACAGQSKLANILFAKELARREAGGNIKAYSVHPGAYSLEAGVRVTGACAK